MRSNRLRVDLLRDKVFNYFIGLLKITINLLQFSLFDCRIELLRGSRKLPLTTLKGRLLGLHLLQWCTNVFVFTQCA